MGRHSEKSGWTALLILGTMQLKVYLRINYKIMASITEEFKVAGKDLKDTVKKLLKDGNARRIIIKNDKGETVFEIPLTFGAIGAIIAPVLAAVGAVAAILTDCTIVVEKKQ